MKDRRAFTLIELLIVVAIIAILAAIAVPNFLEAQTRAKVSRIKADQRSLATAIESYRIDNNAYPPSVDPSTSATFVPRIRSYVWITTPISYITSAFPDVFNTMETPPAGFTTSDQRVIVYWAPDLLVTAPSGADTRDRTAAWFEEFHQVSDGTDLKDDSIWALISFSPDQDFDVLDPASETTNKTAWWAVIQEYDPTNGTLSDGDIVRFRQ